MIDFYAIAARQIAGLPDAWLPYSYEVLPGGTLVKGKIPLGTIERGKRKGRPKWGPDDGRHVFVSEERYRWARIDFEERTGKCSWCTDGLAWFAWGEATGHRYRDCRRCEATGLTREAIEDPQWRVCVI